SRRQPAVAMPESAASFERRTDLRVDLRNDFLQRRRRADVLVRRLLAPRVERALIRREKVEPGLPVVARAAYACAQHAVRLPELLAAVGADENVARDELRRVRVGFGGAGADDFGENAGQLFGRLVREDADHERLAGLRKTDVLPRELRAARTLDGPAPDRAVVASFLEPDQRVRIEALEGRDRPADPRRLALIDVARVMRLEGACAEDQGHGGGGE